MARILPLPKTTTITICPSSSSSSASCADSNNLGRQGKDSGVEGYPLRLWSIEIYVLNELGEQVPATLFDKVTYKLHPSFEARAIQGMLARRDSCPDEGPSTDSFIFCLVIKNPPFRIQEEGWGEFDMTIGLGAPDKEHNISHDLNFQQNRYESKHVIVRPWN